MNLLPPDVCAALPLLNSQENEADPLIHAKLFDPTGSATWYVLEGASPEGNADYLLFTYVTGLQEDELGHASLRELEGVRGALGRPLERDLSWTPCRLSEIRNGAGR